MSDNKNSYIDMEDIYAKPYERLHEDEEQAEDDFKKYKKSFTCTPGKCISPPELFPIEGCIKFHMLALSLPMPSIADPAIILPLYFVVQDSMPGTDEYKKLVYTNICTRRYQGVYSHAATARMGFTNRGLRTVYDCANMNPEGIRVSECSTEILGLNSASYPETDTGAEDATGIEENSELVGEHFTGEENERKEFVLPLGIKPYRYPGEPPSRYDYGGLDAAAAIRGWESREIPVLFQAEPFFKHACSIFGPQRLP